MIFVVYCITNILDLWNSHSVHFCFHLVLFGNFSLLRYTTRDTDTYNFVRKLIVVHVDKKPIKRIASMVLLHWVFHRRGGVCGNCDLSFALCLC